MAQFERYRYSDPSTALGPLSRAAGKRRHRRVNVGKPIQYRIAAGPKRQGMLDNLSLKGAAISSLPGAVMGDRVEVFVPDLGTFEGRVIRVKENGFSLALRGGKAARVALADALTVFMNEDKTSGRAVRFPAGEESILETMTGEVAYCSVLDVSASGASISCALKPKIGDKVRIGRKRATVVRHHPDGFAVSFPSQA